MDQYNTIDHYMTIKKECVISINTCIDFNRHMYMHIWMKIEKGVAGDLTLIISGNGLEKIR